MFFVSKFFIVFFYCHLSRDQVIVRQGTFILKVQYSF